MLTLHIVCSSTSDIAFSIMWGSVLVLYWAALPYSLISTLYKLFNAAAITLCMALSLQLLLLAADMAGTTHWSELRPILPDILSTHAGNVLLLQFICVLLAPAIIHVATQAMAATITFFGAFTRVDNLQGHCRTRCQRWCLLVTRDIAMATPGLNRLMGWRHPACGLVHTSPS